MNFLSCCFLSGLSLAALSLGAATPAVSHPFPQPPAQPVLLAYEYAYLVSSDARSPINVRDDASTRAYARHIGYAGDRVEVMDRSVGTDGYMWYYVRFTVSNATGWIRGDFISLEDY
jgi:hypothetical protein